MIISSIIKMTCFDISLENHIDSSHSQSMNVSICHHIIKNILRNGALLEPKGGDSQTKRMLIVPFSG